MYTTSTEYKKANLEPNRNFESEILIGTRKLTNEDLISFTIEQSIQQDDTFSIGNTIASCLNLVFLHDDIETDDKDVVNLKLGLLVNEVYKYIPLGIYNISSIDSNDTTTTLVCFDNMIKFDIPYIENIENPTLYTVINRLTEITGVQFGGILTDYTDYSLSILENYSCREVLGFVAGVLGSNAIIDRMGKFDFISISTEPIYNQDMFTLTTKDGTVVMTKDSEVLEVNAQEGLVNTNRYYDYTKKNKNYKIKKIVNISDVQELSLGLLDENSVYLFMQNPLIDETILKDIYSKMNGLEFLPYSLNWNGDISVDLGDLITVTDKKGIVRAHPVLSQIISYNGALNTVLGAQGETKTLNEYTTTTSEENEISRVGKKVVQVEKDAGELYVVVYDEENQSSVRLTEKMLEAIADEINLTANNINLEGLVTANNNFKILLDGSIEAVNGKFTGNITGSKITGTSISGSTITSTSSTDETTKVTINDGNLTIVSKDIINGNDTTNITMIIGNGGITIGDMEIANSYLHSPIPFVINCPIQTDFDIYSQSNIETGQYIRAGSEVQVLNSSTGSWIRTITYNSTEDYLNYGISSKNVLLQGNTLNLKSEGSLRLGCNGASMTSGQTGAGIIHLTGYELDGITIYTLRPTLTNATNLGSSSNRWQTIYSVNALSVSSDRNVKENIQYIEPLYLEAEKSDITLDDLYNFIKNDLFLANYNYQNSNKSTIGFIAQDLLEVDVNNDKAYKIANTIVEVDEENNLSYDTGAYVNVLAGALKKAIDKIENLENKIANLEEKINLFDAQMFMQKEGDLYE